MKINILLLTDIDVYENIVQDTVETRQPEDIDDLNGLTYFKQSSMQSCIVYSVVLTSYYIYRRFLLTKTFSDGVKDIRQQIRKRAYILSEIVSYTMSVGATYQYVWYLLFANDIFDILPSTAMTEHLIMLYLTYIVADSIAGIIDYPDFFSSLYVFHHIIYFIYCLWVLNENVAGGAIFFCMVEIPTFILAHGIVNDNERNDTLFIVTFIVFRIGFNGWMVVQFWGRHIVYCLASFAPFTMHVLWFTNRYVTKKIPTII